MALTLELIARNRDAASGFAPELAHEGDVETGLVRPGHRIEKSAAVLWRWSSIGGPLHARHHSRLGTVGLLWPAQNRHGAEHRPGTHFDDRFHPQFGQGLDASPIFDRLADLATPVRPVHFLAFFEQSAGHGAHQRYRWRGNRRNGSERLDLIRYRIHHGAVVAGAPLQSPDSHVGGLESRQQGLDVGSRSAHHQVSPVVSGNSQARVVGRDALLLHRGRYFGCRGEHRSHRTGLRQPRHELAPSGDEPKAVFQAEHARGVGGGKFAQAVPDHHAGSNPQARPQCGQRALQRIDGGLGPRRIVQISLRVGPPEHHGQQGTTALFTESLFAAIQHRSNHRFALIEGLPHTDPLAALAGVGKRQFGGGTRPRYLFFGIN